MGKPTGFKEFDRKDRGYRPVDERVKHYGEFTEPLGDDELKNQGARCMDCGIPYCHNGCPVNNIIPDFNDATFRGNPQEAIRILHSTNNFPEVTGRICPAPCEAACTLNLTDEPVTIKTIEYSTVEKAWAEGWVKPIIPRHRTDKKVAVVGSGPAGMACAQQLARAGHKVVVYEKNARIGGLLRYGIPDFKLEKSVLDRRMAQMQAEGVEFRPNMHIGVTIPGSKLMDEYDAIVLAGGSESPRDLPVTGRDQTGVHYAMEFLAQNNRRVAGEPLGDGPVLHAEGKHVIVIGGGDTGSDCVGTSVRHGAASVTQIEIMPKPPESENKLMTWPEWPMKLRTSTSHDEGCDRDWAVTTKEIIGDGDKITAIKLARVEWVQNDEGQWQMSEVEGSEFELKADLIFLAMGFVNPIKEGLLEALGTDLDGRGNVAADTEGDNAYATNVDKVFAAGDVRRGQSLVVWAIREGRQAARSVDEYLMGSSTLPR